MVLQKNIAIPFFFLKRKENSFQNLKCFFKVHLVRVSVLPLMTEFPPSFLVIEFELYSLSLIQLGKSDLEFSTLIIFHNLSA